MISQEELNKYREECIRICQGEITRQWEVSRMNSKNFPNGDYRVSFPTKKDALFWIEKNGWKLWGYWEKPSQKTGFAKVEKGESP